MTLTLFHTIPKRSVRLPRGPLRVNITPLRHSAFACRSVSRPHSRNSNFTPPPQSKNLQNRPETPLPIPRLLPSKFPILRTSAGIAVASEICGPNCPPLPHIHDDITAHIENLQQSKNVQFLAEIRQRTNPATSTSLPPQSAFESKPISSTAPRVCTEVAGWVSAPNSASGAFELETLNAKPGTAPASLPLPKSEAQAAIAPVP